MKRNFKFSAISLIFIVLAFTSGSMVAAASASAGILPKEITDLLGILGPEGVCASQYVNNRVKFVFFLVLGGLVVASVVYSIIAAYKYITSQGDTGKIEEANKSIKAIFMGIAAMVVGIVGMVIVFTVVGARPTNPALFQTCINAPASEGCKACQENIDSDLCGKCERIYEEVCNNNEGKNIFFVDIAATIQAQNAACK